MKYIDADILKTEIESELSAHDKVDHLEAFEVGKAWNRGHRNALENILSFITSLQEEQNPKVMQEVSDNVDKLRAISTPAEEDWFKISEEWEKEDKR